MLVLSRKRDEVVRIGSNVLVYVVDIRGDKVRLGFECPRELSVHREEVFQAVQRAGTTVLPVGRAEAVSLEQIRDAVLQAASELQVERLNELLERMEELLPESVRNAA